MLPAGCWFTAGILFMALMQIDLLGLIGGFVPSSLLYSAVFLSRGVECEFQLLNKVNPSSDGFAGWQELDPAELPGGCGE